MMSFLNKKFYFFSNLKPFYFFFLHIGFGQKLQDDAEQKCWEGGNLFLFLIVRPKDSVLHH